MNESWHRPVLHRNSWSRGDHHSHVTHVGHACTHATSAWGSPIKEVTMLQDLGQDTCQYSGDACSMAVQPQRCPCCHLRRGWRLAQHIWMWLRAITPTKGVVVRQCILQLFSEAGQWASLINANELLAPSSSELRDSIQATYEPGTQLPSEILMKDQAIWLGKYVGMTYIHATCLEGLPHTPLPKQCTAMLPTFGSTYMRWPSQGTVLTAEKGGWKRWINLTKSCQCLCWQTSHLWQLAWLSLHPFTMLKGVPLKHGGDSDVHIGNVNDSVTNNLYK